MKQNKIFIYALMLLLFAGVMGGCADFLDVEPKLTKESDKLYRNEDGYKFSLNGVYAMLGSEEMYGRDMSMMIPELLARHWVIPPSTTNTDISIFSNYKFDDFRGDEIITSAWTNIYKAIAQLNDLLEHIRDTKVTFSGSNRRLIEGEARALRGFLHMEALRLWGPAPSKAAASVKAVPYVTEPTLDPHKLLTGTFKTVVDGITDDLNRAEELLKDSDPATLYAISKLSEGSVKDIDPWLSCRQESFNYYAVLGAKARFYNWLSACPDYASSAPEQAIRYARDVIAATAPAGQKQFQLTTNQTINENGLVFYGESLFGIHNPKLGDIIQPLFKVKEPELTQRSEAITTAYELDQGGSTDVRYNNGTWKPSAVIGSTFYHFYKFGGNTELEANQKEVTKNVVPVIRLAEMYLILVERLPLTGGDSANEWFELLRNARSMPAGNDYTMNNETERRARLEKEYRKEFFGEGQMFFFYKRFGYTDLPWPATFPLPQGLASYAIPMPRAQQSFE